VGSVTGLGGKRIKRFWKLYTKNKTLLARYFEKEVSGFGGNTNKFS